MGWRGRLVFVAAAAAAVSCGGGGTGTPNTCVTTSDCPAGQACVDGRCVGGDGGTEGGDGLPEGGDDAGRDDGPRDYGPCVDSDGDGRGVGCAPGPDCDDADPLHWEDCSDCPTSHDPGCLCLPAESYPCYSGPPGTEDVGACTGGTRYCVDGHLAFECTGEVVPLPGEVCGDGADNDCNGVGDEEAMSPCGDCDPTCRSGGPVEPDPEDPGSMGLISNPDGPGVTLGHDDLDAGFAWIANADEGTVSKLELATGVEASRFRVGLTGTGYDSPSRTAVDGEGNAYVASRAHVSPEMTQGSVTKMAGDRRYCVDRNGDTVITTSEGPTALTLGADECILWTVPACGEGGIPRALAIDAGDDFVREGYPWVGCWSEQRFLKLDPGTGAVLGTVDVDVNPYGAAIDHDGYVWAAGMRPLPGYIQRFNPVSGAVEEAVSTEGTGCSSADETRRAPYGITIDGYDRVWVTSFDRYACRYDPSDGSWLTVTLPRTVTRGIAAGEDGRIWAANYDWGGNAIVSFLEDGTDLRVIDVGGVAPIGVGLDELGHVWTVNQSSNNAARYTRAAGVLETFSTGTGPYSYSDFTGYQRRIVVPRGVWTRDYERCSTEPGDHWGAVRWDADVPSGASLAFTAQSAATPGGLDGAPQVELATVPSAVPPVDIEAAFAAAGQTLYRLLRLTVVLEASPDGAAPVLRTVEVTWHCLIFG